jgi:hypothetical protein
VAGAAVARGGRDGSRVGEVAGGMFCTGSAHCGGSRAVMQESQRVKREREHGVGG